MLALNINLASFAPKVIANNLANEAVQAKGGLASGFSAVTQVFNHLKRQFILVQGLLGKVNLNYPTHLAVKVSDCRLHFVNIYCSQRSIQEGLNRWIQLTFAYAAVSQEINPAHRHAKLLWQSHGWRQAEQLQGISARQMRFDTLLVLLHERTCISDKH